MYNYIYRPLHAVLFLGCEIAGESIIITWSIIANFYLPTSR